ncbi:ethanolamine utilization protein EutH [Erysipelothrix rhusiopathiae]|nr:ethanolamine utilization protein EutH [Erysipelothrix rhusiopathiae]
MKVISDIVIYIIMACAVIGCFYSIKDSESELGQQFTAGIEAIGGLFIPIAGIMAALPILNIFISKFIAPLFTVFGADAAMAATSLLAVDMGGYQLAAALAQTHEAWIISMTVGYMAGATIVFSIPIATKIIDVKYHRQLSVGTMIGFITIPIGVFITNVLIMIFNPMVRTIVSSDPNAPQILLNMTLMILVKNLLPLIIICLLMAIGLWKKSELMIKGFQYFSKFIEIFTKAILTISILEHFTHIFTNLLGGYILDPIIADSIDIERALEVSGYIGLMLSGALPMVYLIETKLKKPIENLSDKLGISRKIATGILASSANVIAAFAMIDDTMSDREMIAITAFSVCGAFVIGDHLAFTANFQPQLILPLMIGKLTAGLLAVWIALKVTSKTSINNAL